MKISRHRKHRKTKNHLQTVIKILKKEFNYEE